MERRRRSSPRARRRRARRARARRRATHGRAVARVARDVREAVGELAAAFGHELVVPKDEKTATAHRFVAALRRHFGPGQVEALEERVEGWLIELVRLAGEVTFEAGDAEGRLRAWRALDELDPEVDAARTRSRARLRSRTTSRPATATCAPAGRRNTCAAAAGAASTEGAVGMLEAIGLEQPNPRAAGACAPSGAPAAKRSCCGSGSFRPSGSSSGGPSRDGWVYGGCCSAIARARASVPPSPYVFVPRTR